jgi:hypothetical protein
MVYLIFGAFTAFFFLVIIRDRNVFSSCLARIETFFVVFPASIFIPARAVDRFSAVFLASVRSRVWRNICYFNF